MADEAREDFKMLKLSYSGMLRFSAVGDGKESRGENRFGKGWLRREYTPEEAQELCGLYNKGECEPENVPAFGLLGEDGKATVGREFIPA